MNLFKKLMYALLFLCSGAMTANAQMQLVWQDEFNYTGLPDPNKWGYDVGAGGWGNGEAQYYQNARMENSRVENGNLIIEARRDWAGAEYSSCRLVSRGKGDWTYGRIEVRAKIPVGQGLWPAIWMLPTDWAYGGWPASGEIDIMESFALGGLKYDKVEANIHTQAYNHTIGTNKGAPITGLSNIEQNFHVYGVTWTATQMIFDVDGRQYFTFNNEGSWQKWPFDKRFHLIMNIAVGGSLGTWIDPNIFPKRMEVDYVRVYQQGATPPSTTGLVTAYKDCNYAGFSTGLDVGDYTLSQLQAKGLSDNDISSLRITQGYKAILFDGDNFTGASTTITSDMGCSADWNDKTTSIRIRTNGDPNLSGIYCIKNRNSGLLMDVTGGTGATGDGAKIQQWNSTENTNQQFRFEHLGDGTYKITAIHSGKVLDIDGVKLENGTRAQQWAWFGSANQQFIAVPTGDGYFKLVAKHSGRIVEVSNASTAPEGIVQQWDNNNQICGMWQLNRPAPVNGTGDGLAGSYFNGMNFESAVFARKDASLNMSWGTGSPNAAVNAEQFSVRWTGQVQPRYSGEYTFYINSDNGRRVWINNQLIIDKWADDWNVWHEGKIVLERGVKYDIKVEYFENNGGADVKLEWASPVQGREIIPVSQLYANPTPAISITSPTNNTSYNSPASIAITANASDNGSITKVDFYNGNTLISSDNTSPYSINWNNVVAGNYTIKAIAFDNSGAFTISSTVAVSVVSDPLAGNGDGLSANYFNGMNFETLRYSVKDATLNMNWGLGSPNTAVNVDQYSARWTGQIQPKYSEEYTFYITSDNGRRVWINNQLIIDQWVDNWDIEYSGKITLVAGQKYDIKVEYFENNGGANIKLEWSSASQSRAVVPTSQLYSNSLPVVNVSSNAVTAIAPANFTFTATASDADGISKVDFYNGTTLLGTDNVSPYTYAWTNVAVGSYSITALATDTKGGVTRSSVITVTVNSTVNQLPTVNITAPANNATYNAPASISFTATASDADGTISKVEYFNGSASIGSSATAPYSINWNNVAAGTYTITAKATDNQGAVTTSSAITVKVNPVVTNPCSGTAQYAENAGYVAGSIVQNAGSKYQCKPWPASGWCNGAAWAYGPGTGQYWGDAWTLIGSCSARMSSSDANYDIQLNPNPTSDIVTLQLTTVSNVSVYNTMGTEVIPVSEMQSGAQLDLSVLPAGMYWVRIEFENNMITKTIIKK